MKLTSLVVQHDVRSVAAPSHATLLMSILEPVQKRIDTAIRIARLGADFRSKLKLLASYSSRPLYRSLGRPGLLRVRPSLALEGRTVAFEFSHAFEYNALLEVFDERHYECDVKPSPRVVLDLGSNIGLSVAYFHLRYPRATIHAVEADPVRVETLRTNVASIDQVTVHPVAVSNRSGTLSFFHDPVRGLSSSTMRRSLEQVEVSVEAQTLDELLARIGTPVDLVKFDIEGAEWNVFSASKRARDVRHLIGELHFDLGRFSEPDFRALFPAHEFRILRGDGSNRPLVELTRAD